MKTKNVTVEKIGERAVITVLNNGGKCPSIREALTILGNCPVVDIVYTPELELDL